MNHYHDDTMTMVCSHNIVKIVLLQPDQNMMTPQLISIFPLPLLFFDEDSVVCGLLIPRKHFGRIHFGEPMENKNMRN